MEVNYFTILYWFCHTSTWIRYRYPMDRGAWWATHHWVAELESSPPFKKMLYIYRIYIYIYSRQEYWRGLPFPTPGNLLDQTISVSLHLLYWQIDSLTLSLSGKHIILPANNIYFLALHFKMDINSIEREVPN